MAPGAVDAAGAAGAASLTRDQLPWSCDRHSANPSWFTVEDDVRQGDKTGCQVTVVFRGEVYTAVVAPLLTMSVHSAELDGDKLVLQGLCHAKEGVRITINTSTGEVVVVIEEGEGDYFAHF